MPSDICPNCGGQLPEYADWNRGYHLVCPRSLESILEGQARASMYANAPQWVREGGYSQSDLNAVIKQNRERRQSAEDQGG